MYNVEVMSVEFFIVYALQVMFKPYFHFILFDDVPNAT